MDGDHPYNSAKASQIERRKFYDTPYHETAHKN